MIMPTKKFKASILVVTMMIMGIILVSALSISLVSIQERKASMGANKSNQAYQIADTGIETVMDDIVNGNNDQVSDLTGCRPADGLIHNDATGYTVELKDADENKIACNTNTDLSEVVHIKSVGTASGQAQRSIEAAVAASDIDWANFDSISVKAVGTSETYTTINNYKLCVSQGVLTEGAHECAVIYDSVSDKWKIRANGSASSCPSGADAPKCTTICYAYCWNGSGQQYKNY